MLPSTLGKARTIPQWPLAIHEAAHVVVARRLGIRVSEATIEADHESCGHIKHEAATVYENILIGLAGPLAERRLDRACSDDDPELAAEEAEYWDLLPYFSIEVGIPLKDDRTERHLQLRTMYNDLATEAQTLLAAEWYAIERFALALLIHKTMSARMVALCDAADTRQSQTFRLRAAGGR